MCKKLIFLANNAQSVNFPVFKPFSGFEAKHYIKKMAHKIKNTLDSLELKGFLKDEKLDTEDDTEEQTPK